MKNDPSKRVSEILGSSDANGHLTSRESTTLEYKETFAFGGVAKYLKSFAAFANTEGGLILFGIGDAPRKPIGIDRKKFDEIGQEKVSSFINDHFSPYIPWSMGLVEHDGKCFGYFDISEAAEKPIICKKNGSEPKGSGR